MDNVGGQETGDSLLATSRGGLVSARGTSDGVVLRLDGRVPDTSLKAALSEFMEPRKTFLGGQEISLEWIGVRPGVTLINEVTLLLQEQFGIAVKTSKTKEPTSSGFAQVIPNSASSINRDSISSREITVAKTPIAEPPPAIFHDSHGDDEERGLFAGIDDFAPIDDEPTSRSKKDASQKLSLADPSLWDDPDARVIYSTLRSGQRIESEHSLIIIGDINPGAEVVAGGDVFVLGSLRGVAHAGAYDETGGGRTIFALILQPTQLRIGTTMSRGSSEGGKVPEIAKVEGNMIVVEPFIKKSGPKRW